MASAPRIHPTALISADAEIADNVCIGPFAIVDGPARIGPDCVLHAQAQVLGRVTLGRGNVIHAGAVLGDQPQHLKYAGEATSVEIGDHNIFREGVTIHRATTASWVTRIGSHNFFMANSHVAHDCTIGNRCIFANGALLGGHCVVEDNVFLSGNTAVHQFCRVGKLAFLSGCSSSTKDILPFTVQIDRNCVAGLNLIGLRRAGYANDQIAAVRIAFRALFCQGLTLPLAIAKIEQGVGHVSAVQEMLTFVRQCKKGINLLRRHHHRSDGRAEAA